MLYQKFTADHTRPRKRELNYNIRTALALFIALASAKNNIVDIFNLLFTEKEKNYNLHSFKTEFPALLDKNMTPTRYLRFIKQLEEATVVIGKSLDKRTPPAEWLGKKTYLGLHEKISHLAPEKLAMLRELLAELRLLLPELKDQLNIFFPGLLKEAPTVKIRTRS